VVSRTALLNDLKKIDTQLLKIVLENNSLSDVLVSLAAYCDYAAMEDENLVVQEYHDQWMAARTEILRCADTIRKGW